MYLSRDNETDSLVTKAPRLLPIAQDPSRQRFSRPCFIFLSLFIFSHDAESQCRKRSIWYWCLLTDVLLAFAVEILSTNKQKKLNIITIFYIYWTSLLCCCVFLCPRGSDILFFFLIQQRQTVVFGALALPPLRGCQWNDHLSTPILLWEVGLLIGPWSRCSAIVTMPFQSR